MSHIDAAREDARRANGRFGVQLRDEVHTDLVAPELAAKRAEADLTSAWAGIRLADVDIAIALEDIDAARAGRPWPWKGARIRSAQARLDDAGARRVAASDRYDDSLSRTADSDELTPDQQAQRAVARAAANAAHARMMLVDADNDQTYAAERADEKLAARRVKHLADIAAAARREEDRVREIHGVPDAYRPQAVTDGIS